MGSRKTKVEIAKEKDSILRVLEGKTFYDHLDAHAIGKLIGLKESHTRSRLLALTKEGKVERKVRRMYVKCGGYATHHFGGAASRLVKRAYYRLAGCTLDLCPCGNNKEAANKTCPACMAQGRTWD